MVFQRTLEILRKYRGRPCEYVGVVDNKLDSIHFNQNNSTLFSCFLFFLFNVSSAPYVGLEPNDPKIKSLALFWLANSSNFLAVS